MLRILNIISLLFGVIALVMYLGKRTRLYRINPQIHGETVSYYKNPKMKEAIVVFINRFNKDKVAGFLHNLMILGLILMIVGLLILLIQALIKLVGGSFSASSLIANLMAWGKLFIIVSAILFMVRRISGKVRRLERSFNHFLPLIVLCLFLLIGFFVEGVGVALKQGNSMSISFISRPIFSALSGLDINVLNSLYNIIYVINMLLLLAFLLILPRSKFYHIFVGLKNLISVQSFKLGRLKNTETVINDSFQEVAGSSENSNVTSNKDYFGLKYIENFSQMQLLQLDDCVQCGRCDDVCPAFKSGKALSPQQLIQDHKKLLTGYKSERKAELIRDDAMKEKIWDCNLCYACESACPSAIEHVDKIVGLRRNMVLNDGDAKKEIKIMLRNLEKTRNPFGFKADEKNQLYKELGIPVLQKEDKIDYLLWIGCHGLFEQRMKTVLQSLVRVLNKAGKTFAALDGEEVCCGDPARRVGEENLFQIIMHKNIGLFNQYNVSKIITICPHCFNTFKKEYPTFGVKIEAYHYLEVLPQLLNSGVKTDSSKAAKKRIVYHDSCYLGRINEIYEQPRQIISKLGNYELVSLDQEKEDSLCCGGGGGRIWVEEAITNRPSVIKLSELEEKQVQMVITSCPYCLSIYSDTSLAKNTNIEVKDLLEIINL